ncbi:TonB-dependent receptor [Oceanicaulis sp.]|uniref:TonB-dependent receptor n=1 Tax=Oceanicaulis sp. TaxID=1924941 RepID=UPI003F7274D8
MPFSFALPLTKRNRSIAAAVLCGSVSAVALGAASAQDAEPDVIVVRGSFTASLADSLAEKRTADGIVDAIVAADIGKLPAVNVAEALQRIPGVTIVREGGEGQFISVRGLGPNFQAVTMNGMPLAYNENIRNSGQSGRQFRLRVIPSDLIDGIVVAKTPTADLVEMGIGSSVDIRTVAPLDRDSFVSGSLYGSYEERTDDLAPNGSLAAGWRNADSSFGVIGGLSFSQREVQFERLRLGWGDVDVAGLGTVRAPGDIQPYLEQEDRERMSAVGGLQWRLSDTLEFKADALYSIFNNEVVERRLTYYIPSQLDRLDLSTAVVEDGYLLAGTINGARIRNYTEFLDQQHENINLTAGFIYEVGGWEIEPKFSYALANSDLTTPISRVEMRTGSGDGGNLTFDLSNDVAGDAEINALYTDLDLTDPSIVPYYRFRYRPINSEDEDKTFTLDVSRDLDMAFGGLTLTRFMAGGQYSDRYRDYQRRDRDVRDVSQYLRAGYDINDPAFMNTMVPGNTFDESIVNGQLWTSANIQQWMDAFTTGGEFPNVSPNASDLEPTAGDLQNSYRIGEEITAFYSRVDFASEFQGVPLDGNVGLRYVSTDTNVLGTTVAPVDDGAGGVTTAVTPTEFDSTYEEFLPSLNVTFDLTDDVLLRLGAARTMTRPSLSELRNSINTNSGTVSQIFIQGADALNDDTLILTASAGNPELTPYTSWNYDLSFEWYFDEFGAFTAAAFYKDVSDYIASDVETRTLAFAVQDGSTLPVDILVSTPVNVGDASISGIEFGFTNKLEMGLGVTATATFATTKLELAQQGVGVQSAGIQGVSDTSLSITPFFERGPISANLSYTWRDDYLTDTGATVTSRPTDPDEVGFYQKGYGTLDFGASYQVNDWLELYTQGTNLLNEQQVSYQGVEREVTQIHTYGRTLYFGVRGSF